MPATLVPNSTLSAMDQSLSLQFNAYSMPAINVSPAPIGLVIVSKTLCGLNISGFNSLDNF